MPIIVIVVVVLAALLGYTLWITRPNTDSTQNSESTVQTQEKMVDSKKGTIDDSFPIKVSWTYPATWNVQSEELANSGGVTTQKITITSPSGKYSVVYSANMNGGIGGACIPNETTDTLQHIKRQPTDTFSNAVFAEFIYGTYSISNSNKQFDGYTYIAGLFKNSAPVQTASVGDSYCKIYLQNALDLSDSDGTILLSADIKINADKDMSITIPSDNVASIKAAFEQPEYHDAVKILLSTVVEQ